MAYVIAIPDRAIYYGGFFNGFVSNKQAALKFSTREEAKAFIDRMYRSSSDMKIVKV